MKSKILYYRKVLSQTPPLSYTLCRCQTCFRCRPVAVTGRGCIGNKIEYFLLRSLWIESRAERSRKEGTEKRRSKLQGSEGAGRLSANTSFLGGRAARPSIWVLQTQVSPRPWEGAQILKYIWDQDVVGLRGGCGDSDQGAQQDVYHPKKRVELEFIDTFSGWLLGNFGSAQAPKAWNSSLFPTIIGSRKWLKKKSWNKKGTSPSS